MTMWQSLVELLSQIGNHLLGHVRKYWSKFKEGQQRQKTKPLGLRRKQGNGKKKIPVRN